jgi:3-hydroxyisobutyrate dehydrogenase-like beta-hydroxyacid dehydrogenase
MGLPMARNLLRAGHDVTVYNRTRERAEELRGEGAKVASTPAEACVGEIVFTMLADDAAVEAVVFGGDGILGALTAGALHVSLSTIGKQASERLEQAHRGQGQHYVAAPVFGRPDVAALAKLTIVAAGPIDAMERCRPALEVLGQKVFHIAEEPWKANVTKLAGNFMLASMLETFGEVFALLRKSGIDPKQFLEIANGSVFRSPVYENYGKIITEGRFAPAAFKLRLGLKDVKLALAAAEDAQVPMPLASLLRDHFLSGVARGKGDLDWAALAQLIAEDAGL